MIIKKEVVVMKKIFSFVLLSGIFLSVLGATSPTVVNAASKVDTAQTITLPEDQDGIPSFSEMQPRSVTQAYVTNVVKFFQSYPPARVPHGQTINGAYLSGTLTRTSVRGVEGGYAATYAGWLYK